MSIPGSPIAPSPILFLPGSGDACGSGSDDRRGVADGGRQNGVYDCPVGEDETFEAAIEAGRRDGDRIVAVASADAVRLMTFADREVRNAAFARVQVLRDLRADLLQHQCRIDRGLVTLVEALAETGARLTTAAREADFSNTPMGSPLHRTVEVRLAQTREISLRLGASGASASGPSFAV